jgi:hypothetical protein
MLFIKLALRQRIAGLSAGHHRRVNDRPARRATIWAITWTFLAAFLSGGTASGEDVTPSPEIRQCRSTHFQMSTDLPVAEAQEFLKQMERVLGLAERYWGRTLPGRIRCYLVKDLKRWTADQFPAPEARRVLLHVRGGTDLTVATRSNQRTTGTVIYAMAEPGVIEHEVVHAYCFQTFGHGGPGWYREGMAELFAQQVGRAACGPCRPETLRQLRRQSAPPTIQQITSPGAFNLSLVDVSWESPRRSESPQSAADAHWPTPEHEQLIQVRTAYAESWALCYLLSHNRNYRDRFRSLGKHLLAGSPTTVQEAFAGRLDEINFELAQFTSNLEVGYQTQLCDWDWSVKSRELGVGHSVIVRLSACRGFQSAQVQLCQGQVYLITAQGTWHVEKDGEATDADGDGQGRGCLEGAVLDRFALGEPELLGTYTQWTASDSGQLYLRCRDPWDRLADNRGVIVVRLTRVK